MSEQWTEREVYVKVAMELAEDFPDGAFWGFMQESEIDVDEVVAVSQKLERERGVTDE